LLIKTITKYFTITGSCLLQVTKTHGSCVHCTKIQEHLHEVGNGPNRQHAL